MRLVVSEVSPFFIIYNFVLTEFDATKVTLSS